LASIRYIVTDLGPAIEFYRDRLGFTVERRFGPAMAILVKDDLKLWLAGPQASASRPMPDGRQPEPGGWNRFVLEVEDLPTLVDDLTSQGVTFRNAVVEGPGGRQILCEDPSGNVIELFEPA
jgi:catechol 2,3-dioxygenase-like lactoylglutathione lyase family enzyme